MVGVVLMGMLGYYFLPISALPAVDFPTIVVNAQYPGASPEVMASSITTPLERQFGQISGLGSMNSVSSSGVSTITLQFNLERSIDSAAQDVQAAIEELNKRGAKKVGVTGFCWGGTITWLSSTRLKPDAAVAYYGGGIHGTKSETPHAPTMMHFGDKDMHIPMTHVNEIRKLHPEVQVFDYPADHGFHCDERGSFDEGASKKAMERTLEFMKKHVG